jgi:HEXXH motif-containing protein
MRESLAQSLAHIHAVAATQIGSVDKDVAEVLSEVRLHRVRPGLFGRYYSLVLAVHGRRYEDGAKLFREIVKLARERPTLITAPFTDDALGADKELFARLLSPSPEAQIHLAPPTSDQWLDFEKNVEAALRLIEQADVALANEIRALVVQIVGAASSPQNDGRSFGGMSSGMLWGAIFLNVARYGTPLDMVEALIHEAAHHLLFGLSLDEPLVENSIEQRYGSPLRTDPRPMDGVFHATFICARIHYGYGRLRQLSNEFSETNQGLIDQRLHDHRQKFTDGLATVKRFGLMTPTGERLLAAASDYMRSAA